MAKSTSAGDSMASIITLITTLLPVGTVAATQLVQLIQTLSTQNRDATQEELDALTAQIKEDRQELDSE